MIGIEYDPEEHDELAQQIANLYGANPTLTTNLVASQLEANVHVVSWIIDSFLVDEDGIPTYQGPGLGGNWLAVEHQASFAPPSLEELGMHIGWRWPDGTVREDVFDDANPDHVRSLAPST